MKTKSLFHGWISMAIILLIMVFGIIPILMDSIFFAGLYLFGTIIGFLMIFYSFCSKCPCRQADCRHIILGPIADKLFKRTEGKYSFFDYFLTTIGVSIIILFPQLWLIKKPVMLILFWTSAVLLVLEISINICRTCNNHYCPCNSTK